MRTASRLLPAAIALIASGSAAHAQWSADPGLSGFLVRQNVWSTYDAISLGADGILFAAGDYTGGTSIHYLVVQRLSAQGTLPWGAAGVRIGSPGSLLGENGPVLAPDGAGGAFAFWQGPQNVSGSTDIIAQRIDVNGALLWPAPRLDEGVHLQTSVSGNGKWPWWASPDGTGGFIAAWARNGSPHLWDAQRVTADGTVLWGAQGITVATSPAFGGARFVSDGAGGLIVFWSATGSGGLDLFAQRFGANGSPLWAPGGVPICSAPGDQGESLLHIAAISDEVGGAYVAWIDERVDLEGDVYAQRIDASGTTQWATGGVPVCAVPGKQSFVAAATDGAGGLIAAWQDSRASNPPTGVDLYAQRIGSDGVGQWVTDGKALTNAPGDQIAESSLYTSSWVAPDGAGGLYTVWTDRPNRDVYAQHLDASGIPIWPAFGLRFGFGDYSPAVIPDGTGACVVSWVGGIGLRARPSSGPVTAVGPAPAAEFVLRGGRPNPATGSFGVDFSLERAGPVRLDVFDVAGRLATRREESDLGPGAYVLQVGPLKPGLYFLRLTQSARGATARVVVTR